MSNLTLLILVVIAVFVVSRALRRVGTGARRADDAGPGTARGQFAAVSIHTFRHGCPPAEKLQGRRFLVNEAPLLPLADCSYPKCNCRYVHHSDRRTGTGDRRRLAPATAAATASLDGTDRRHSVGRRASDLATARELAGAGPA